MDIQDKLDKMVDEMCGKSHEKKKKKKKEKIDEQKLRFGGYHLRDNILDEITVGELQELIDTNIPNDKINDKTVQKEFNELLNMKLMDARAIVKKVIPELVKNAKKNNR